MFHERFREAFPEYSYVGDLMLFDEASQCFINQFKQVNVKPLAVRVRIEPKLNDFSGPKDFKLIDQRTSSSSITSSSSPSVKVNQSSSSRKRNVVRNHRRRMASTSCSSRVSSNRSRTRKVKPSGTTHQRLLSATIATPSSGSVIVLSPTTDPDVSTRVCMSEV